MKIGIITFHASYNFGSALQAYALQCAVEALGHEASIIDYLSQDFEQYKLFSPLHPRRDLRTIMNLRGYLARRSAFTSFASSHFNLTQRSYSFKNESELDELQGYFDCFICGSDQIWNLDCTHGAVGPFFLSFAGDKRRIAYAPSLALTAFKPEDFDKKKVASLLGKFDYLSVREAETLPLFQPLVDKPIDVVLDPTLLLDVTSYGGILSGPPIEGEYVFMYLLRKCPELVASTVAMAKESNKKVVYVSEKTLSIPNSVNLFGMGPTEFLSAIACADAVMTNSFHATVFSVLFHKPFRAFAVDKTGSRMRDLLGELALSQSCANHEDGSAIEDVDWVAVDARLASLREHSWDYLKEALA